MAKGEKKGKAHLDIVPAQLLLIPLFSSTTGSGRVHARVQVTRTTLSTEISSIDVNLRKKEKEMKDIPTPICTPMDSTTNLYH